jgi:capsular polysaccharide biosynthesis protein
MLGGGILWNIWHAKFICMYVWLMRAVAESGLQSFLLTSPEYNQETQALIQV